jgi:hypothetical protein
MKYLVYTLVFLLLVVVTFPAYVKWHLSKFEEGFVYTVLNLFTPPSNYFDEVISKDLHQEGNYKFQLSHNYSGKYIVTVISDKEPSFIGKMRCNNKVLEFSSKDALYLEGYKEYWLTLYSVPSDVPFDGECILNFNTSQDVVFKIIKHAHT